MPAVNVEEMTFGVEIETSFPRGEIARVGSHGNGIQVSWLPRGWLADADPSIHGSSGDHRGVEFVSPVLSGSAGLRELIAVIQTIKAKGGKINNSCGLHVHVGFDRRNQIALSKLVALVANFEKAIYASTGTKSRESGRWCGGFQRYGNLNAAMTHRTDTRYFILNTTSDKPTVEFRAFAATLKTEKVVGHVLTCLALVEKALRAERLPQFTAKPVKSSSPIARKGDGQTALCRMFYALGWIKGRETHVHGNLTVEDGPSLKVVKGELMRLAKKYDTNGAGAED